MKIKCYYCKLPTVGLSYIFYIYKIKAGEQKKHDFFAVGLGEPCGEI